jgi:hypothetical protein
VTTHHLPDADHPPLAERRKPRCAPFVEVTSVEQLLPYLDSVARRPYESAALHAGWDLREGERVLLRADNWHDPMAVEACRRTLESFGTKYDIEMGDRGPIPEYDGHDEVEVFLEITRALATEMEHWAELDRQGRYDKILWGFGGPVLSESSVKIGRMPFITPEMIASAAHTLPYEILQAIDRWTFEQVMRARSVHVTDPEGTDLRYSMPDAYFNENRSEWRGEFSDPWWPQMPAVARRYVPGHVFAMPAFFLPEGPNDAEGVIAGTMNHIGPYPLMKARVSGRKILDIEGGGRFGEKLRKLQDRTAGLQYPGFPDKGLLYLWELSIGTNPKIHRPRQNYLQGLVCALYERMRSGVIHLGFGTIVSSAMETEAAKQGLPVGHFHIHLYFPTVVLDCVDGDQLKLIDDGRLCALDAPEVRAVAEKYGDPDVLLAEDWIPAVPGINCAGSYAAYAADPTSWTKAELTICRDFHDLYMKMVGAEHGPGHHHAAGPLGP